MNPCKQHSQDILRYLENELTGHDLEHFRVHLRDCVDCRALFEEEQELSNLLRRSRPLYMAPAVLRARVYAEITRHVEKSRQLDPLCRRIPQVLWQALQGSRRVASWRALVPVAVVITLCLILVPEAARQVRAADYVTTAVAAHRSYLSGKPPEIQSDSPQVVTAWVADRVPFHFCLPASQSTPTGKLVYRLTGARLLDYKGSLAALITYETSKDKISLLVAPGQSAVVAGGDELHFGPLTFHYRRAGGFEVITWSNHGLSYALVSNLSGSARQSCLVCHQNMADRKSFRSSR